MSLISHPSRHYQRRTRRVDVDDDDRSCDSDGTMIAYAEVNIAQNRKNQEISVLICNHVTMTTVTLQGSLRPIPIRPSVFSNGYLDTTRMTGS